MDANLALVTKWWHLFWQVMIVYEKGRTQIKPLVNENVCKNFCLFNSC